MSYSGYSFFLAGNEHLTTRADKSCHQFSFFFPRCPVSLLSKHLGITMSYLYRYLNIQNLIGLQICFLLQDCFAHDVETVLLLLDPDGLDLEDVAKTLGRRGLARL